MVKRILNLFLIIGLFVFIGCKKNELGGKSGVSGNVLHHGKPIANAVIYIKFNAKDFPGTDLKVYDTQISANMNGYFEIFNLYKGDYYFYAVGEDPAISAPYLVVGGMAVSLKSRERKDIDIAVGEE